MVSAPCRAQERTEGSNQALSLAASGRRFFFCARMTPRQRASRRDANERGDGTLDRHRSDAGCTAVVQSSRSPRAPGRWRPRRDQLGGEPNLGRRIAAGHPGGGGHGVASRPPAPLGAWRLRVPDRQGLQRRSQAHAERLRAGHTSADRRPGPDHLVQERTHNGKADAGRDHARYAGTLRRGCALSGEDGPRERRDRPPDV